jgi:hypothetical protein
MNWTKYSTFKVSRISMPKGRTDFFTSATVHNLLRIWLSVMCHCTASGSTLWAIAPKQLQARSQVYPWTTYPHEHGHVSTWIYGMAMYSCASGHILNTIHVQKQWARVQNLVMSYGPQRGICSCAKANRPQRSIWLSALDHRSEPVTTGQNYTNFR